MMKKLIKKIKDLRMVWLLARLGRSENRSDNLFKKLNRLDRIK